MAIPPLLYKTPVMSTKKPRIDSYQFSSTIINNNTKNECKHTNFLHELPPTSREIHPTSAWTCMINSEFSPIITFRHSAFRYIFRKLYILLFMHLHKFGKSTVNKDPFRTFVL